VDALTRISTTALENNTSFWSKSAELIQIIRDARRTNIDWYPMPNQKTEFERDLSISLR
jgi:hypothetical protein